MVVDIIYKTYLSAKLKVESRALQYHKMKALDSFLTITRNVELLVNFDEFLCYANGLTLEGMERF